MIDWGYILPPIVSAFVSGGLVAWLSYKVRNRNVDTDQFRAIVDEYKELRKADIENINALRARVNDLETKHQKNVLEIAKLRNQLVLFEGSHVDSPLPTWLKDTDGKMLFLNDEYEKLFLIPLGFTADDYIGHHDCDIWDEKTCEQYVANDKKVVRTKKAQRFIENVQIGENKFWIDVIKYPRKLNTNVIGIGGQVLRKAKKPLYIDKDEYQPQ